MRKFVLCKLLTIYIFILYFRESVRQLQKLSPHIPVSPSFIVTKSLNNYEYIILYRHMKECANRNVNMCHALFEITSISCAIIIL